MKNRLYMEKSFLTGLSKDLFLMNNEIKNYEISYLLKFGKTCLSAIPGEPLPVGDLNIMITNKELSFKEIDVPYQLDQFKTHIVVTKHQKILVGLFMILAELLHLKWNNYFFSFKPSVFNYIISSQIHFLKCLEEKSENFEKNAKENFFYFLQKTTNNELKMLPQINNVNTDNYSIN